VHHQTVQRYVARAMTDGALAALEDRARPGREPVITQQARAWLIDLACHKAKELGYPHEVWTTRLLAKHAREHGPAAGHLAMAALARHRRGVGGAATSAGSNRRTVGWSCSRRLVRGRCGPISGQTYCEQSDLVLNKHELDRRSIAGGSKGAPSPVLIGHSGRMGRITCSRLRAEPTPSTCHTVQILTPRTGES
jgi:hypothetical protein